MDRWPSAWTFHLRRTHNYEYPEWNAADIWNHTPGLETIGHCTHAPRTAPAAASGLRCLWATRAKLYDPTMYDKEQSGFTVIGSVLHVFFSLETDVCFVLKTRVNEKYFY